MYVLKNELNILIIWNDQQQPTINIKKKKVPKRSSCNAPLLHKSYNIIVFSLCSFRARWSKGKRIKIEVKEKNTEERMKYKGQDSHRPSKWPMGTYFEGMNILARKIYIRQPFLYLSYIWSNDQWLRWPDNKSSPFFASLNLNWGHRQPIHPVLNWNNQMLVFRLRIIEIHFITSTSVWVCWNLAKRTSHSNTEEVKSIMCPVTFWLQVFS